MSFRRNPFGQSIPHLELVTQLILYLLLNIQKSIFFIKIEPNEPPCIQNKCNIDMKLELLHQKSLEIVTTLELIQESRQHKFLLGFDSES